MKTTKTTMTKDERILNAIFTTIDEVNEMIPKQRRIAQSLDTVVLDKFSQVDSLMFVTLIAGIEDIIEEDFDVVINLADEKMLSQNGNPFKTIATLADHISLLVSEKLK